LDRALKNIAIYVLIVLLAVFALKLTSSPAEKAQELTEPEYFSQVSQGLVATADIEVDDLVYNISGKLKDGSLYITTVSKETGVIELLLQKKVAYDTKPVAPPSVWMTLLTTLLPIVILIAFLMFIMNQTQGGGNKVMQFGKSKARLMAGEEVKTSFKDVAGAEEAKEKCRKLLSSSRIRKNFVQIGAKIPKRSITIWCSRNR